MTIRHFNFYLAERRLIQTDKLESLKGIRLGIDAFYWLGKLVSKDAYSVAMGGIPVTLPELIDKELALFKKAEITPIFVFAGLSITKKDKPFAYADTRAMKRAAAWNSYEKDNLSLAVNSWIAAGKRERII
jgi:hypothetical protein